MPENCRATLESLSKVLKNRTIFCFKNSAKYWAKFARDPLKKKKKYFPEFYVREHQTLLYRHQRSAAMADELVIVESSQSTFVFCFFK